MLSDEVRNDFTDWSKLTETKVMLKKELNLSMISLGKTSQFSV